MEELTQVFLRSLVKYYPGTGKFVRLSDWKTLGWPASKGYVKLCVAGRVHFAHRLAWFYMTGSWPTFAIDHKNRTPDDNRWKNLRDIPASGNQHNRFGRGYSISGEKFVVRVKLAGKHIHIGSFQSKSAARAAYIRAKREYHPEAFS